MIVIDFCGLLIYNLCGLIYGFSKKERDVNSNGEFDKEEEKWQWLVWRRREKKIIWWSKFWVLLVDLWVNL